MCRRGGARVEIETAMSEERGEERSDEQNVVSCVGRRHVVYAVASLQPSFDPRLISPTTCMVGGCRGTAE